jgi:serine/threonine protein kinase
MDCCIDIVVGTVDKKLRAMIIDFDNAVKFTNPVGRFTNVGTFIYWSPECFKKSRARNNAPTINFLKNDIWALGVLLYTGLYQKFPYACVTKNDPQRSKHTLAKQMLELILKRKHSYKKPKMGRYMLLRREYWKYNKLNALLDQLLEIDEAKRKTAQEFGTALFQ